MTKVKETNQLQTAMKQIVSEKRRCAEIQMLLDTGLTVDRKDIKWLLDQVHKAIQDKQHEIF